MQVIQWKGVSKDIITNYVEIISNYAQITSNYVEITILFFTQWLTSVKSTHLVIIIDSVCAQYSQSMQWFDFFYML